MGVLRVMEFVLGMEVKGCPGLNNHGFYAYPDAVERLRERGERGGFDWIFMIHVIDDTVFQRIEILHGTEGLEARSLIASGGNCEVLQGNPLDSRCCSIANRLKDQKFEEYAVIKMLNNKEGIVRSQIPTTSTQGVKYESEVCKLVFEYRKARIQQIDCPSKKIQNRRNKSRNKKENRREAREKPYVFRSNFDVIIGMDWLANHHAVIVCDERDRAESSNGDKFDSYKVYRVQGSSGLTPKDQHEVWFTTNSEMIRVKEIQKTSLRLACATMSSKSFILTVEAESCSDVTPRSLALPKDTDTMEKLTDNTVKEVSRGNGKCFDDESLAIPLDEIQIDDKPNFIEEPIEIMDREFKTAKSKPHSNLEGPLEFETRARVYLGA
ncbi:hypothetical protein Tco_0596700 [Tanacetum coccineum]